MEHMELTDVLDLTGFPDCHDGRWICQRGRGMSWYQKSSCDITVTMYDTHKYKCVIFVTHNSFNDTLTTLRLAYVEKGTV